MTPIDEILEKHIIYFKAGHQELLKAQLATLINDCIGKPEKNVSAFGLPEIWRKGRNSMRAEIRTKLKEKGIEL